ncbi:MAG: hypothetical protein AAFQ87_16420, partial [Bacteroidota bacterium]
MHTFNVTTNAFVRVLFCLMMLMGVGDLMAGEGNPFTIKLSDKSTGDPGAFYFDENLNVSCIQGDFWCSSEFSIKLLVSTDNSMMLNIEVFEVDSNNY